MKKLIFLFLFSSYLLDAQTFSFDVDTEEGYIESVFILEDNIVYKISKAIDEIYIFNADSSAQLFIQIPERFIAPKKKFQLGGADVYVESAVSVEYYKTNSYWGASGQIKSINGLEFTYAPDNSYNRNAGVVGKLAGVGKTKVTYWVDAGYTERGKYRGKIKSLGARKFDYEGWSSWGEKAGMVGRLIRLGELKIGYYDTDYALGYKGKIESIGEVEFTYYRDSYENKRADIVGKFKLQTGYDERLIIR